MLRLRNISTFYDRIQALRNVSIHVQEKEIVSLIGANGAGKTTLLNTISGILRPADGEIIFDEKSIQGLDPDKIVKMGICQVPEGRQIFNHHTVVENLELGAFLRYRGRGSNEIKTDLDRMYQLFPILAERRKQLAGNLSGGEQQMLAIARALMARPKVLLLDEPSMGLAPKVVREIFETILRLRKEGATILLVEQNARAALAISDRAYVLETGRLVLQGEAKELVNDPEVRRAYLGKDYREVWE
jgi:branched-chain amino acid transport system ATP-binding protein